MRYHIDTIPVWDALHKGDECPLCLLRRKTEHMLADRFLGASVMEPDTRIKVNDKGFCQHHHRMLYDRQNRLGHALMMLSHLKEVQGKVDKLMAGGSAAPAGLFGRRKAAPAGGGQGLNSLTSTCLLCESLDDTMRRYAYTMAHLWKTDKAFETAFSQSKGLCIPDADLLLQMAAEHLSGKPIESLRQTLHLLMKENLQRLYEELEWFTLKFDYRNQDKPWGQSRDALERSITKLRGWCVGSDPGLEP